MKPGKRVQPLFFLTLALTVLVAVWIRLHIIPYAGILWDEAVFLTWVFDIVHAVRAADAPALISASYQQLQYAPVHSWIMGLGMLPFSFTIEAVRSVQLILFISAAVSLYVLTVRAGDHIFRFRIHRQAAGAFATLLFVLSPLVLFLSGVVLKEIMGTLFSVTTMILYFRWRRNGNLTGVVWCGLSLLLLFMTKYQYGVFLAAALGIEAGISLISAKHRIRFLASHLVLILPVVIFGIVWFLYPQNRFATFLGFLLNDGFSYTGGIADRMTYLLFYLRAVTHYYAVTPTAGICILLLSLPTLRFLRLAEVRSLWIGIVLSFILLTRHTDNVQERYLITVIPYLFSLSSIGTLLILRSLEKFHIPSAAVGIVCAALYLGTAVTVLPYRVYAVGSLTMKGVAFPQPDYNDSWFNYNQKSWPVADPRKSVETPARIIAFLLDYIDADKPVYVAGAMNELSPPYVELARRMAADRHSFQPHPDHRSYIITIQVDPASRYYTRDYQVVNAWRAYEIPAFQSDSRYIKLATKTFQDLGITVGIYAVPEQ